MSSTARDVRARGTDPAGGEAASLVESAMLLRWRAPELALLLADRAVRAAQEDTMSVLRADHLAVFTLNHLGRHAEAAHRLFPAVHDAQTPQGLRHELHVELAHCAVALGEPATALGAAHPVLAAGDDVAPALRGGALVAAAEASVALGYHDLATSALEEADELYREDPNLDHDTSLLLRAAARAADAARHRARGAADDAEVKAREGRELLARLADPDHDSGEVSARLMLELALLLLDRGTREAALQEVRPLLRRPVRAAAAASVGRLRLAIATRVHLTEGRHEPALTLLADAVEGAQRYGMDMVLAECLEGLSHVHEARDEFADALHCMRAARAAEARHLHEVSAARATLLEHCGSARREEKRLVGQISELLGNAGTGGAGLDADTPGLPVEISAESEQPIAPLSAPEMQIAEMELAEPDLTEADAAEPEVAVADPGMPGPVAAEVDATVTERAEPDDEEPVEDAEPVRASPDVESTTGVESWQSRARHRRGGAGSLVSVSDLLPASALSTGRSGRRRAEELTADRVDEQPANEARDTAADAAEEAVQSLPESAEGDATGALGAAEVGDLPVTRREFPASGPPSAPAPRSLEWEPADDDSAEDGENHPMGLGDLLAEALAAYQESRDVPASDSLSTRAGADADTSGDLSRYRGLGARWTAGLTLATSLSDPSSSDPNAGDADEGRVAEATTNPLLRLPDLTAEPRWSPPATGRRPAVGD